MTLPATVNKIVEWAKNNKQLALIVALLIVFFVLIVSALIPERKGSGVALIEQPLYFYKSKRVVLEEDAYEQVKHPRRGLEIYKIKEINQNIKVEGIISLLNITAPEKDVFANNLVYEWKNKSGDSVMYDIKTQQVVITLENRKDIFPEIVSPSDSQLKELLPTFVKRYVNSKYEYYDVNIRRIGTETIVEGRRKIGDYPLQRPGIEKYYDYITLDDRFHLKSASILMVEVEDEIADKLKIIKPDEINSIASNDNYPREINQAYPEGLKQEISDKEFSESDNFGFEIPKVTSMRMNTLEIVYLYSTVDQKFITPVYSMSGTGNIIVEGSTYEVRTHVNLSAIDPNYVYVPSNIIYTQ